jgi:hypothetical protein
VPRQARIDHRDNPEKIEPMLAIEPTESRQPSEPTEPMDRIEPAEPIDKMEPDEPIDRIDPLEPMLRIDPEEPAARDEPTPLVCMASFWQPGPGGLRVGSGRLGWQDRGRGAAGGQPADQGDPSHRVCPPARLSVTGSRPRHLPGLLPLRGRFV